MWQLLLSVSPLFYVTTLLVFAVVAFTGVVVRSRAPQPTKRIGAVVLVLSTVLYFAILTEPVKGWNAGWQGTINISLIPLEFLFPEHIAQDPPHWQEWMLNLLLFVPLGIIAALVFNGRGVLWCFGPALSLTVEVTQTAIATGRQSAVDDLLANSIGYFTGVCFVLLAGRIVTRDDRPKKTST